MKRLFAGLIAVTLVLSMIPYIASAQEGQNPETTPGSFYDNSQIQQHSLHESEEPAEYIEAYNRLKEKISTSLNAIQETTLHLKSADPSKLNVAGYTDATAKLGWPFLMALGLQETVYDDILGADFNLSAHGLGWLYVDKELTQQAVSYDNGESKIIEAPKYYLEVSYSLHSRWQNETIKLSHPIEVTFEYVDPVPGIAEKIEENSSKLSTLYLEDLAWINTRIITSLNAYLPAVENPQSFLRVLNKSLYQDLVGNTGLEVYISFGSKGDAIPFIGDTDYHCRYFLDGVFYGFGAANTTGSSTYILMRNVLYVPSGTSDRASIAGKRVNDYIKCDSFIGKIDAIGTDELINLCYALESSIGIPRSDVKAAYLTEYGVVAYSDEHLTDKAHCLGILLPVLDGKELFHNGQLEESSVTLDYVFAPDNKEVFAPDDRDGIADVKTYKPYRLTLTDNEKNVSKSYLYAIAVGTEDQLKEPYADWTDANTNIKIKGQNGYVPFDAYTKIRIIKGGSEIKFIQSKVGNNKSVHAFDINAYTNFKGGKLHDLGNGLMQVMIPLGLLKEDGVTAHYVDAQGNVQDLQFTIEEDGGTKYVCFITNHFSTYAICGIPSEDSSRIIESPKTGHGFTLAAWTSVSILAAAGIALLLKKRSRI